ncbi:MAG: PAS domain S-box protein [Woeseia sp.]|nr:PAS domain S-box protein [Woeseia sp.]MBT8097487.1 PAS domain S-box protein [Woeseia sp.]NNE60883.1 PAS domain S-box protein [Woeseia sp.]NNL55427.1 PAS domain S-box protein [Woeseia sp.]
MDLSSKAAQQLLSSASEAMLVVSANGEILVANRQAESLFRYSVEEMIGKPVEILMPEASRSQHAQHRERYRGAPHARPLVSGLNLQGRKKDGETFDAEISLTPVEDGEETLVASTIRDISDRDSGESYFRELLQAAPDAMIIVDEDGRIAIANDQSEIMFGYPRDELVGQPIEMLLPDSVRKRHVKHRRGFVEDPRLRPMGTGMELYAVRADGSEFPVEISLSPVRSAGSTFVSSVIRDVTERKTMEAELIEARQVAERAHKANTAFLAAASHDLRQPVQALSLLNGALRRTAKDELSQEMIQSQQNSLDAMTNLLNSLLDISRLDAGAVKPEIEDFPVRRLIDRLSAEFSRQARQKHLIFLAEPNGTVIRSDPNLLSEIIQNLVSNAIRYTERGEVSLTLQKRENKLSIDIRDTGIGIADEHLGEIFREFHQLNNPGSNNEGFGLGLAIVSRLAELLGHKVRVISEVGKGSCFSVVVPIVHEQAAIDEDAPHNATIAAHNTSGLILLIEDDRSVSSAWTLLLKAEGYDVLLAETADDASIAIANLDNAPDLIISDYHLLDGSNGVEAVERVREHFGRNLPAFIVSGDTSKVVDDAKRLRNSLLMSKPVHTDELLALAAEAIPSGSVSSVT